jgi:hypothetical protein
MIADDFQSIVHAGDWFSARSFVWNWSIEAESLTTRPKAVSQ